MRLVQVAKILGISGQQLRQELTQVNFGVKPTDREVADGLAHGVIRFLARKYGKEIDMTALAGMVDEEGEDAGEVAPAAPVAEAPTVQARVVPRAHEEKSASEVVNVLRKLTLEDVPKDAIAREQKRLQSVKPLSKAEREAQLQERRREQQLQNKTAPSAGVQQQIKKKEGVVKIPAELTVKEFAEKAGIQVPKIIQALMSNGIMATINQPIDFDTAAIVAAELGVTVLQEESVAEAEHLFARNLQELLKDDGASLEDRAPIVVVMGHVDHGKTSILDSIRKTDVAAGEAGGITQHIGAYQVLHKDTEGVIKPITFLDTPGHEAFTAMRARGAQVTDIAVIVVAADEGVKPTTIEAINHAKEAGVPIIVALNKMDKEGADTERVKGEMAGHGLQPEEWGGEVPFIPCSAKTGLGIDNLLNHILLSAEIKGCKANPNRAAVATVIESRLDPSMGPLATLIINTGTLKTGDAFLCGLTTGRIRAMMDDHGVRLPEVKPSGAVRAFGFAEVPTVGDILQVVPSEQQAKALAEQFKELGDSQRKRNFADLVTRISQGKVTQLKVVLKTDTQGGLEALQSSLHSRATDQVSVKVIHAAIGAVTENDVIMAAASDGLVIAFHVDVPTNVKSTADQHGVRVREYDIVYKLLEEVDGLLSGLIEPEEQEQILGHLEIKGVFFTKRSEQIVGGRVTDGTIKRLTFRLLRGGEQIGTGKIVSLKRVDKDIKEADEGSECGMKVDCSVPLLEGDVLEVFLKEFKKKSPLAA